MGQPGESFQHTQEPLEKGGGNWILSPGLHSRTGLGNPIPRILKIILLWIMGSRMREGRSWIHEGPDPRSKWRHLRTCGNQMELVLVVKGMEGGGGKIPSSCVPCGPRRGWRPGLCNTPLWL